MEVCCSWHHPASVSSGPRQQGSPYGNIQRLAWHTLRNPPARQLGHTAHGSASWWRGTQARCDRCPTSATGTGHPRPQSTLCSLGEHYLHKRKLIATVARLPLLTSWANCESLLSIWYSISLLSMFVHLVEVHTSSRKTSVLMCLLSCWSCLQIPSCLPPCVKICFSCEQVLLIIPLLCWICTRPAGRAQMFLHILQVHCFAIHARPGHAPSIINFPVQNYCSCACGFTAVCLVIKCVNALGGMADVFHSLWF
jgi:hypothetical protein